MSNTIHLGVGFDTARYGHRVSFLRPDLQPAAKAFTFAESPAGYRQLKDAFKRLADRHGGNVHFDIRLDAAGQYAVNLEAFLRSLDFSKTISVGQPKQNADYKSVHFPKRKADAVDSLACARFAVVEAPAPSTEIPTPFVQLRDLASALAGQRKQTTQQINRLHNQLARVFPELAILAPNLAADWVLTLLARYPTPERIAAAHRSSLEKIPHVDPDRAELLQDTARQSIGSQKGPLVESLIRQMVDAVRQSQAAEAAYFELLEQGYDALPDGGHRQSETIPGIGKRTAAALVAKVVSIDRFPTPETLVSYFGAFPEENTSGVDKWGNPVPQGTMQMSAKGCDLVRGLLWMASQSAINCNPAIAALYRRQRAAGKRGDVALGHCMRKLLHLVFALWKTNKPFDPNHYPWEPADDDIHPEATTTVTEDSRDSADSPSSEPAAQKGAAGRKGQSPVRKAVTAAAIQGTTRTVPPPQPAAKPSAPHGVAKGARVDFAQLRRQISIADALTKLGWLERLNGRGAQRHGPCPIHQPDATAGRCFSVNLDKSVFRCLHPDCGAQGNVLDLWAAIHRLNLRDAALHLAGAFGLNNHQTQPAQTTLETHP